MTVRFFEQDVASGLKERRRLSAFIQSQVTAATTFRKVDLSYVFCTDAYLLTLNQQYLAHDTLTDIITFDLSENEKALSGEIYISTESVAENAKKFKVDYLTELHRVIFHGALHLCGYGDKTKKEKEVMRGMEEEWLGEWGCR